MTEVQTPPATERVTGPPRRFPWRALLSSLVVLLLGAALTTWLVLANRAHLDSGPMYGPGQNVEVANDGVRDTRWVVVGEPGRTFSLTTSVVNSGRVPVTLERFEPQWGLQQWIVEATYVSFDNRGGVAASGPLRDVTLDKNDWIQVELTFRVPDCWFMHEDGYTGMDTIRWRTRALGIGGVSETALVSDMELAVVGSPNAIPRPPECPPLGQ